MDIIRTGYHPRPFQDKLHGELKRFNVLVCHRRFGKTVFSINHMLHMGLMNQRKNPMYAYIAPNYRQAKRIAWQMIKDYTKHLPGLSKNEQELTISLKFPDRDDEIKFMLLGAENPDALRGIYLDGVIMDEFAQCDPVVWTQVVRPALVDRQGWAIFIGTPKGRNHFYNIYMQAKKSGNIDWYTALFKASETGLIPQREIEGSRASGMSDEEIEQEFECSFAAATVGAYYAKDIDDLEKQGRITGVPYDPALPVDTFWDLGIGDATSIWFLQQIGQEYHLIDYIEETGRGLDWYVRALKDGHRKRYDYRDHVFPHDVKARELGTGKTRVETLRSLGIRATVLPRQSVDDGIHAVRMLLPKCWFDKDKCEKGLEALRSYEKEWDSKQQMFKNKPKHNWTSHAADSFRYLALGQRPTAQRSNVQDLPRLAMDTDYDILGDW